MSLNVIKEAFTEGRETDIDWNQSEAKENQVRLETFVSNTRNFDGHVFGQPIALEQVCPKTGKTLATFSNRLEAAKWIVTNVLRISDPNNRKAMSITGNMHMCMLAGFKSYGYYWRRIDTQKHNESLVERAKKLGSTAIFAISNTAVVKTMTFASIGEAAKATGVPATTIRANMYEYADPVKGWSFRPYNPRANSRHFRSVKGAAMYFGTKESYIRTVVAKGMTINGVTLKVAEPVNYRILVQLGKTKSLEFKSCAEAGAYLGVSRFAVQRAITSGEKVNLHTVYRTADGVRTSKPKPRASKKSKVVKLKRRLAVKTGNDIQYFPNIITAARELDIPYGVFYRALNGKKRLTSHSIYWAAV